MLIAMSYFPRIIVLADRSHLVKYFWLREAESLSVKSKLEISHLFLV